MLKGCVVGGDELPDKDDAVTTAAKGEITTNQPLQH